MDLNEIVEEDPGGPPGNQTKDNDLSESMDRIACEDATQVTQTPKTSIPESLKFEVDVNQIATVTVEDQDADIQCLGLTVYNQSTLERGIWDQVERETRKRETQEQLANVSSKLKLAEEQLTRATAVKSNKRSILQSCLEEPSKKKPHLSQLKEHEEATQKKVKELRHKQAQLQAQLNNKNLLKDKGAAQESERDRKIRMGEMTPFGTTVNAPSSDLSSFEKYLKNQQELHKKMQDGSVKKKHSLPLKLSKEGNASSSLDFSSTNKKTSSKNILKKNVLFPKKRHPKEKLQTDISQEEEDIKRLPGEVPGEKAVINLEDSGSEYVPSGTDDDTDFIPESLEKGPDFQKGKVSSLTLAKTKKEKWAGGSLKRRKRKEEPLPDGDPDDWQSDDSDWLCTDDEDFSSDNEIKKKAKQSKRGKDDGNSEEFFRRIKQWERQNEGLRDEMEVDVHEFENGYRLPALIWNKLYIYQQVGVRWMWELNQQKCGGILGDEMGLGKTIQIISFLAGLSISKMKCRVTGYRGLGPTLIVCPTTVMHQWVREFHTWFPPLRIGILHESGSYVGKRSQLVRDMLHDKGIIITSYTAVVRLKDYLLHQRWHYVILDEGHKIRNPDAQISLAVKQLRTPHRLILSGSPLQNNLRELWSLMDFVFPGKLGTLPVFMSEFAVPINQGGYSNASEVMVATAFKCATVLRDTISPYLLRRMKADVSDHIKLPSKNEQVLFCRLTDEQRDLYKGYLQCGEVGRILEGRCQIFVGLINLRKICNHPHLYSGGPKLFAHEKVEDIPEKERFGYWEKAGKMVVIEALLKMWHRQEHRVLVFTQSRQMLLIMEQFVSDCGYRYLKMDGATSIAARQPLINKFNEDKSYFLMLLTTKVGGLGVNLTGANRVVIYDPDWNPATDTQARERAWRIGQQNAVTVYRLITAGTIEEKMYHRQIFKQFLCNKVLKDPRQRRFFKSNDLLELFTLKETDDGTTETSAIFAGTKAQVHMKTKTDCPKSSRNKKTIHHSDASRRYRGSSSSEKPKKSRDSPSINFSQDKLEHMKRLAHELSLKLSNKVSSSTNDNIPEKQESVKAVENTKKLTETSNMSTIKVSENTKASLIEEITPIKNSTEVEHSGIESMEGILCKSEDTLKEEENSPSGMDCDTVQDSHEDISFGSFSLTKDITLEDSDEDLEDMKQLAQELGKELSQKVQVAAAINKPKIFGLHSINECCDQTKKISSQDNLMKIYNSSLEEGGDAISGHSCSVKTVKTESNDSPMSSSMSSEPATSFKMNEDTLTSSNICSDESLSTTSPLKSSPHLHSDRTISQKIKKREETETLSPLHPKKNKKHKKHKKHKRKDAVLEGERVRGLVKSSTLGDESKEEVATHNAKQDDYVLRKLFSKAGIKTAMQHEKIMESGHADFALVEGEARKVAQDAVKAMKASRQQCWTAMSGQPTWTGTSGRVRNPGEIDSSSQSPLPRSQPPRPKFGKRKPGSKTLGSQTSKEKQTEAEGGSSSLLAQIRARNLLLIEDDENDSTGARGVVPDSNQELLDDIRTFVAFGASVDGRATTDEIISQFRDRLPSQTSALFKQMLMQICEFHRLPSGQGVWKLIPEFNW